MTRLDHKLKKIRAGQYTPSDFIIADAKDGDMASGVAATAPIKGADGQFIRHQTRQEFLESICAIINQGIVDILLCSASNSEQLQKIGAFENSAVKPAVRANDSTDCWGRVRHARYPEKTSRPFRTAELSRVTRNSIRPCQGKKLYGTDLGLYSVTFVNDVDADLHTLDEFARFRRDAAENGFKYFLEIFNPNIDSGISDDDVGYFVNDCILRSLAGVMEADRPEFLKMPYNGPDILEELTSFDSSLIVGVLGGSAGTTRDTLELIWQSERHGARLALFGRKINLAEDPLAIVRLMRHVVDGEVAPDEAVKAYHGGLERAGIKPHRSLTEDRTVTDPMLKRAQSAA